MGKDRSPRHVKGAGKLKYFYLEGVMDDKVQPLLHRSLHINRSSDTIITWCYPLGKRVTYTYSEVKKHRAPAFSTTQSAKMLNRVPAILERAIMYGDIEAPQFTYGLDENRNKYKHMWSEQNIMEMHALLSTRHRGRPRKDGVIVPAAMPSVRELRAMIRQETILYVKNDQGEFVPTWLAQNFD